VTLHHGQYVRPP